MNNFTDCYDESLVFTKKVIVSNFLSQKWGICIDVLLYNPLINLFKVSRSILDVKRRYKALWGYTLSF